MKPRLLFISLEHWDEIWRRNQFLAVRMQKDFQVVFIGPQLPVWKLFLPKQRRYQKIKIHYVYKFFPERFFSLLNKWLYIWQYPRKTDILWINDHTKYFLLKTIKHQKSIYDITDDWTLLDKTAVNADRLLCQQADKVIVCSKGLWQSRRKLTSNITLIKNGINIQDYHFSKSSKKYFLYTGSLHEDRLDVSLILQIAKNFPKERFVYVGPIFMKDSTLKCLQNIKNIELVGAKPYRSLAKYMAQAKALIVPHRQSVFVNSLDPIKQYEYMLSEVPVITTQVSGFNEWPDLFTVVNRQQFLAAIAQVLRGKIKVNLTARRKAAVLSTWDERYKQVRSILCAEKY